MDDIENDAIARYPPNPYAVSHPHNQGYGYQKHPFRNSHSHPVVNESVEDFNGGGDEEDEYRLGGKDDDEDDVGQNRSARVPMTHVDEDDDMDGDGDENDDNDQQQSEEYGYLKHPMRNSPYSRPFDNEGNNDGDDEDEEPLVGEDEGDGDDDVDQNNTFQLSLNHADAEDNNDGDGDRDEEDNIDGNADGDGDRDRDEEDNVDGNGDGDRDRDRDENGDNDNKQKSYAMMNEDEFEWQPKKQKLKSLMSTYEFAARVPEPSAAASSATKPSFGARNSLSEWTEKETFVLLDAWGDRFLQHGRKSLRSDEWQQVAEKVSEVSKVYRTDTQCRNRLDTLKKKYKKDKIKFSEMGGGDRKWVYFKKMDKLMSSPPQQAGFSCGLDSRESVLMKPRVFVNHANGLDDTRDNPVNTEFIGVEGLERPRAKKRRKGRGSDEASSFKLLADSIQNFSKIYEKIENNKRQQIMELEKMRMDFLTELETQKRQIFERLQKC
ncbi:hypothetical protein KIW84_058229 [Lathyrus oleraceus]|uniref:Myb-like domain-containing protein n=1 Tax=Pisum sativum TaxID=3888 RepID=A0A9D5APZ4_PEA|nr:hypothetical protein KIW84_058229 [Pisum sativum]